VKQRELTVGEALDERPEPRNSRERCQARSHDVASWP